jgi:hypothetical protein
MICIYCCSEVVNEKFYKYSYLVLFPAVVKYGDVNKNR